MENTVRIGIDVDLPLFKNEISKYKTLSNVINKKLVAMFLITSESLVELFYEEDGKYEVICLHTDKYDVASTRILFEDVKDAILNRVLQCEKVIEAKLSDL